MAQAIHMIGGSNDNILNKTWYGIYSSSPPQGHSSQPSSTSGRIFTDIAKAAVESKKLNARFKVFISEGEARRFAETGFVESPVRRFRPMLQENKDKSPARKGNPPPTQVVDERLNAKTCPSVPQKDLTLFRRAVEEGKLEMVMRCVRENPRYLISSYDKPVTVMPGPHYNSLHCAAKSGQKEVAEAVMGYLVSERPWTTLYPNEDVRAAPHQERRDIVIDAYFNTSDKGCGETPLHFACKFGHLEFVHWLLSYAQVDVTRRNKYDQTAVEVAGTRCAETEEIQRKVTGLIQDSRHSVYIPVIRALDNSTPPFLGAPVTPEYLHSKGKQSGNARIVIGELNTDEGLLDLSNPDLNASFNRSSVVSPLSQPLSICAYAGPMRASAAQEFRKVWKTPPRDLSAWRRDTLQDILRSDSERGLERVGRDLAQQQRVSWREYWGFLGTFTNLREEEGLRHLEAFISKSDTAFVAGDSPSKVDQDVLHALPPGGVAQLSDKFPSICSWYNRVLAFPDDERKCWTTPVAVRRKTTPRLRPSSGRDSLDAGLVRNLLSDLSLSDTETPDVPDKTNHSPSADTDIQHILVEGVSKLSMRETGKLFPSTPELYRQISIHETSTPPAATSTPNKLPLPITATRPWQVAKSEPRLRHARTSGPDTEHLTEVPRMRARHYFSYQVIRGLFLLLLVWAAYFLYMHLHSDLFVIKDNRQL